MVESLLTPPTLHRHVPAHASKEVVVVMGALTSEDPGNIFSTIDVCIVYTSFVRLLSACRLGVNDPHKNYSLLKRRVCLSLILRLSPWHEKQGKKFPRYFFDGERAWE